MFMRIQPTCARDALLRLSGQVLALLMRRDKHTTRVLVLFLKLLAFTPVYANHENGQTGTGSGSGSGYGSGYSFGFGSGYGFGSGMGSGHGSGYVFGSA